MLNVNRPELARLQLDPANPATWAISAIQYLSTPYNRAFEAHVSLDPRDKQGLEMSQFKINGVYRFRGDLRPQTVGFINTDLQTPEGFIRPYIKLYEGFSEVAAQKLEQIIGSYDYRVEIPVLGPMANRDIPDKLGIFTKREPKFLERRELVSEVLRRSYTGLDIRIMDDIVREVLIRRCCEYLSGLSK